MGQGNEHYEGFGLACGAGFGCTKRQICEADESRSNALFTKTELKSLEY